MYQGLRDVGLEQIRAGYAWWYREYAKEQSAEDRATYSAEEERAKATRAGLWSEVKPVPPWEWRKDR